MWMVMLVLCVSVTDQLIPGARVLISGLLSLVLDNLSMDAVEHQDHALLQLKSTPSQVSTILISILIFNWIQASVLPWPFGSLRFALPTHVVEELVKIQTDSSVLLCSVTSTVVHPPPLSTCHPIIVPIHAPTSPTVNPTFSSAPLSLHHHLPSLQWAHESSNGTCQLLLVSLRTFDPAIIELVGERK